ncbi:MAG: gamma-glutamyltransferase [Erythrobacter sp.]|jgi:gamma-glutamyltranspeptidase/glutathione hydrolase|nr:gamma-glutamyltransferase [Erythrobacter sp.]
MTIAHPLRSALAASLAATLAILASACAPADGIRGASSDTLVQSAANRGNGAVSAADPRAQAAGEEILAKGGSATDAAIAVMLALTVVEPQSSGIGGGGFLIHAGEGGVTSFDGRETAPAAATPTRFLDETGERLPRDERVISGLSVGVPGNLALAAKAHAEHGKLEWAELFQPAIRLARDGFLMNRRLHDSLAGSKGRADKTEAARAIFFGSDGEPLPVGARVTNPDLARTFESLANAGPRYMYFVMAERLAAYVASETPQDGRMTEADIDAYAAKLRDPVCGRYRVYRVCGMGPPSSGGVAVVQMLGQLERFDLAALGMESPTFWHLFLESQRIAYADRELYIGDADFVPVPVEGLVDPAYIAERSALISPDKALEEVKPGTPPGATTAFAPGEPPQENGTTHFAVVDKQGNAVSYTSTIEGAFGSGLFFEGFYLNNELTDFSLVPEEDGKPVANRVEGGKRPRSSMAPTIVFDEDGEVVLVIGAAGGPTIPVQTARSIIGVLDFGLTAKEALGMPFIMAFGPTVVYEEGTALAGMEDALKAIGHINIRSFGAPLKANALRRVTAPDGSVSWEAARDPRVEPKLSYE